MKKILLIIVCFLLFSCSRKNENHYEIENIINKYFDYLEENDFEKTNLLWNDPLPTYNNADFTGCFKSIKIIKAKYQDDDESVKVNVEFNVTHNKEKYSPYNEGINYLTFEFKKINGVWKIINIGNA